jgi:hypothetical protein
MEHNWTNGTCGRAVKLVAHKSERPDAGEGEFWDLQHPPIACVFKQDQSVFMLFMKAQSLTDGCDGLLFFGAFALWQSSFSRLRRWPHTNMSF